MKVRSEAHFWVRLNDEPRTNIGMQSYDALYRRFTGTFRMSRCVILKVGDFPKESAVMGQIWSLYEFVFFSLGKWAKFGPFVGIMNEHLRVAVGHL